MDWGNFWYYTLAITIVSQLVIWWVDRKDPTTLKWLRRFKKSLPMRASEKRLLEIYERDRRDLARHGLCGHVVSSSAPGPLDTRVGGPLIVPKGADMPTNELGQPLLPLILIRLPDLPDTEGNVLPTMGWIQVLVETSSFEDVEVPVSQGTSFRIVRYAEGTEFDVHPIDEAVAHEHPAWADAKQSPELFKTGLSINFEPVFDIAPVNYYKLRELPAAFGTKEFDDAEDALYYALEDEMATGDVMIGGHAHFTQEDIRHWDPYVGFENLIRMSGSGEVFSWGDAGEASIMVPEKDLGSVRLQNAILYYDFH